jgi:hypothetical protein
MKTIFGILLIFGYTGIAQLKIGGKLNNSMKIIDNSKLIMTNPGGFEKGCSVIFEKHKYDLILDGSKRIKKIFANDPGFTTSEGIKIGMTYKIVLAKLTADDQHIISGWATWYVSKSGWKVAFDYKHPVNDTSKIIFLFKS